MTLLVTGGSGFVGGHLIEALIAQGYEVRALVRSKAPRLESVGVQLIKGDLTDAESLNAAVAGCEGIIHCAALIRAEGATYETFYDVNVKGTEQLLSVAREAGVNRFVLISGAPVIMTGTGPTHMADETWPLARCPWSPYIDTKSLAEDRVREANSEDFKTCAVRPPLIWGAGALFCEILKKKTESGKWNWIDGGHYLYSFCHVSNVCEGTILALEKGKGGEAYNLADADDPVEMRSFAEQLISASGLKAGGRDVPYAVAITMGTVMEAAWKLFRINSIPPATRLGARLFGQEFTTSDAKARRELGYVGRVSREMGLAQMIAYYQTAASN